MGAKHSVLLAVALGVLALSAGCAPKDRTPPKSRINPTIVTRRGRRSCWGVVITLSEMTFRGTIRPEDLEIVESKHGRDLKNIMLWQVTDNGKRLVIHFKPECGDFGSGNGVHVKVKSSAFKAPHDKPGLKYKWSTLTGP